MSHTIEDDMNDTTKLTDEQIGTMAIALESLRKVGLGARALYAYESAVNLPADRDEINADFADDDGVDPATMRDVITTNCEADLDDGRDDVIDYWQEVDRIATQLFGDEAMDHVPAYTHNA